MFESTRSADLSSASGPVSAHQPSADELAAVATWLAALGTDVADPARVDCMRGLESITSAAAAAKARMTTAFVASQRAAQRAAGVPERRVGRGVAAQVGLAIRESHASASRYVGWAQILVTELPETFSALARGEISEWRAMIVARETIWLSAEHRAIVDAALAGKLGGLSDRLVDAEAKRLAYRLDPDGFLARSRAAERDRRVSLRPAPDTMTRLTALLPVAQGVAAYAALAGAADAARATGDARGRGQVMADTLVERITGQATADGTAVEIHLVMTDQTLFHDPNHHSTNDPAAVPDPTAVPDDADGPSAAAPAAAAVCNGGANEPGYVVGFGPIPAGLARDLARGSADSLAWIRRIYARPGTGQLAAIDARRRRFDAVTRQAIIVRDQICRTPWCGAPIRHTDHARSVAEGGETHLDNGAGLCEACNYAKQATGWTTGPGPGGTGESMIITTPTGHTYTSRPPDLPGASPERHEPVREARPGRRLPQPPSRPRRRRPDRRRPEPTTTLTVIVSPWRHLVGAVT